MLPTGRTGHRARRARRIIAGYLAWILLVVAPSTWVVSQQGVGGRPDDDPAETEILLDTVVLELEGPTAGEVEAGLSLDIRILEPERWPPLPDPGALDDIDLMTAVAAPAIETAPLGSDPGHTLVAEAYLSAGTLPSSTTGLPLALFASGVSVLGTGPATDFSLVFDHSSRDGVRAHIGPGEGAKTQRHELAGSLRLPVGGGELDTEAGVVTAEQGLQGKSTFNAIESQQVTGAISYTTPVADDASLTLGVDLRAEAATLTSNENTSDRKAKVHTELWAAPGLLLDWDVVPDLGLDLQFSARYLVRNYQAPDAGSSVLRHRFGVGAAAHIDLGGLNGLELALGWSLGSFPGEVRHDVPFQAVVSGTPVSWLSYRLAAGREVREHGLSSLAARSPYLAPQLVHDDVGWFASARGQFGLGELLDAGDLTLVASANFATYERPLNPKPKPDGETMLYHLADNDPNNETMPRMSIRPGLGVEVGAGETLRVRLDVSREVAPEKRRLNFAPEWQTALGLEARTPDDVLGMRLNAVLETIPDITNEAGEIQVRPEVDIAGFWQQGATTVTLSFTDVLEPFVSQPRRDWHPYLRPGLGAAVTVHVSL